MNSTDSAMNSGQMSRQNYANRLVDGYKKHPAELQLAKGLLNWY